MTAAPLGTTNLLSSQFIFGQPDNSQHPQKQPDCSQQTPQPNSSKLQGRASPLIPEQTDTKTKNIFSEPNKNELKSTANKTAIIFAGSILLLIWILYTASKILNVLFLTGLTIYVVNAYINKDLSLYNIEALRDKIFKRLNCFVENFTKSQKITIG